MYGYTMKKIRKMKGFTQKEVYAGIVSKTFYSDFEAGKYSISVDKFEELLQNLSVSLAEFHYFHRQSESMSSQKLEKEIDDCYKRGQFEQLFSIYEKYYTSSKKEFRYLAMKAYLLVLITNQNFYQLSRKPFGEMSAELENTKMWTIKEIKLAKLVLLSIPEKEKADSKRLFNRIKKELQKYQEIEKNIYEEELTDLLFNRIQSLLMLNDVEDSIKVLKDYTDLIQEIDNLALYVQYHFIRILVGLYQSYSSVEEEMRRFLKEIKKIPVSDCRFYQIIFQLHNEKAKNYFYRYLD